MERRFFSFFLHAHLPWVLSHGRWPHGVEWVCEACVGSYLPLARALRRLAARGVKGGVTLSVSPVLAEQLANPSFGTVLREYEEERVRTAGDDARRFAQAGRDDLADLARRWRDFHAETLDYFFEDLGGDLLGELRALEDMGVVDLATCAATHAYLPLLGRDETIALELELARRVHQRRFGRAPEGLWLPEMAYRPAGSWRPPIGDAAPRDRRGIEEFVAAAGFRWVPVDTSLLLGGTSLGAWSDLLSAAPEVRHATPRDPRPRDVAPARDTRRSYRIASRDPDAGTACFVRDPATSRQVWSGEAGYPGDGAYLEFHKKSDSGGHRYWRVTGARVPLGDKEPYVPDEAAARAGAHAAHFRALVTSTLEGAPEGAILMAPYDAELFGHWWFEGIAWLEAVLEQLHADPRVELTTLGRHAREFPPQEVVALPEGSWGNGGGHDVWRNPRVDWTWDLVLPAEDEVWRLREAAETTRHPEARTVTRAAVRQLLLLAASDWAFLMTTDGAPDYAAERVRGHAEDLARLVLLGRQLLDGKAIRDEDRDFVRSVEERDDLFPELDDALASIERSALPRA